MPLKLSERKFKEIAHFVLRNCTFRFRDYTYIKKNADNSVTVVGMADGEAIVTATATDGSGVSASCKIIVGLGGVEGIEADNNAVEVGRYDIHGRLLSEPTKGINIIKMSDGSIRKEFVK